VTVNNQRANEFNLDYFIKRVKPDEKGGPRKGGGAAPAKAPEKKA